MQNVDPKSALFLVESIEKFLRILSMQFENQPQWDVPIIIYAAQQQQKQKLNIKKCSPESER